MNAEVRLMRGIGTEAEWAEVEAIRKIFSQGSLGELVYPADLESAVSEFESRTSHQVYGEDGTL